MEVCGREGNRKGNRKGKPEKETGIAAETGAAKTGSEKIHNN